MPAVEPLKLARLWKQGWPAAWSIAALLCLLQVSTGLFDPLQRSFSDWAARAVPLPQAPPVTLIEIDDASLAALGPWPWPRELHARLIDRLTEANAKSVVYSTPWLGAEPQEALNQLHRLAAAVAADPVLAEHAQLAGWMQQSQVLLDGDARLAQSLAQNHRTVLSVGAQSAGGAGWPLAALVSASAGVGHMSWAPDSDGRLRAVALVERRADRMLGSLPLAGVAQWRGLSLDRLQWQDSGAQARTVQLGADRWPVDALGRVHPLWISTDESTSPTWIRHESAADVVAGRVDPKHLTGRLVVIGLSATDLRSSWRTAEHLDLNAGDVVAQTAAALLSGHLMAQPAWADWLAVALVLGNLGYLCWVLPRLTSASAWALSLLLSVLTLASSYACMMLMRVELPVALPLAVLVGGHWAGQWVRRTSAQPAQRVGTHALLPAAPPIVAPVSLHTLDNATPVMLSTLEPLTRAATQPLSGPRVGDFLLQHEIGRGAMGRVCRALQISTGRMVAVKTLSLAREFDGFALQEARQRFQREAMAASRLRHPDIVRILDTGEDQGRVWIAMELLPGHDLVHHTCDGTLLPVPKVLEVCARIAAALAHAHAQGVVHRDIKPANVMLHVDEASGRLDVKVTDFGIARITDAARTRTGLVLGSPSYMSPEHLAGRAVDGRSDLYSLGVLLFQMLTGQLPFQGSSVAELMHAVANTPAPDVRSRRPRLPEAVSNIVALALEKRPELRYGDGLQFAEDLRCVAALWRPRQEGTAAEPPSRWASTTV